MARKQSEQGVRTPVNILRWGAPRRCNQLEVQLQCRLRNSHTRIHSDTYTQTCPHARARTHMHTPQSHTTANNHTHARNHARTHASNQARTRPQQLVARHPSTDRTHLPRAALAGQKAAVPEQQRGHPPARQPLRAARRMPQRRRQREGTPARRGERQERCQGCSLRRGPWPCDAARSGCRSGKACAAAPSSTCRCRRRRCLRLTQMTHGALLGKTSVSRATHIAQFWPFTCTLALVLLEPWFSLIRSSDSTPRLNPPLHPMTRP